MSFGPIWCTIGTVAIAYPSCDGVDVALAERSIDVIGKLELRMRDAEWCADRLGILRSQLWAAQVTTAADYRP